MEEAEALVVAAVSCGSSTPAPTCSRPLMEHESLPPVDLADLADLAALVSQLLLLTTAEMAELVRPVRTAMS